MNNCIIPDWATTAESAEHLAKVCFGPATVGIHVYNQEQTSVFTCVKITYEHTTYLITAGHCAEEMLVASKNEENHASLIDGMHNHTAGPVHANLTDFNWTTFGTSTKDLAYCTLRDYYCRLLNSDSPIQGKFTEKNFSQEKEDWAVFLCGIPAQSHSIKKGRSRNLVSGALTSFAISPVEDRGSDQNLPNESFWGQADDIYASVSGSDYFSDYKSIRGLSGGGLFAVRKVDDSDITESRYTSVLIGVQSGWRAEDRIIRATSISHLTNAISLQT